MCLLFALLLCLCPVLLRIVYVLRRPRVVNWITVVCLLLSVFAVVEVVCFVFALLT